MVENQNFCSQQNERIYIKFLNILVPNEQMNLKRKQKNEKDYDFLPSYTIRIICCTDIYEYVYLQLTSSPILPPRCNQKPNKIIKNHNK